MASSKLTSTSLYMVFAVTRLLCVMFLWLTDFTDIMSQCLDLTADWLFTSSPFNVFGLTSLVGHQNLRGPVKVKILATNN
jgi:hypothetical protein